ncbi:MAG: hypothetical protein AAGF90_20065 [Pseudomonadota bacterium]
MEQTIAAMAPATRVGAREPAPPRRRMSPQERMLLASRDMSGELAFDETRFVRNRIVRTERYATLDDVLASGENRPEEALADLYMEARAAMLLAEDCAPLLVSMALKCRITEVEVGRRRDGRYHLTGSLSYAPGYDMGAPAPGGGEIIESSISLTPKLGPSDSVAARELLLDRAVEICAGLRHRFDNCFVSRVAFTLSRPAEPSPGSAGQLLTVYANFAVHGVWSKVNQHSLDAAVEELAGAI